MKKFKSYRIRQDVLNILSDIKKNFSEKGIIVNETYILESIILLYGKNFKDEIK